MKSLALAALQGYVAKTVGHYTRYRLEAPPEHDRVIRDRIAEIAYPALAYPGPDANGRGTSPFAEDHRWGNVDEDACKWYTHEKDCLQVSAEFPDVRYECCTYALEQLFIDDPHASAFKIRPVLLHALGRLGLREHGFNASVYVDGDGDVQPSIIMPPTEPEREPSAEELAQRDDPRRWTTCQDPYVTNGVTTMAYVDCVPDDPYAVHVHDRDETFATWEDAESFIRAARAEYRRVHGLPEPTNKLTSEERERLRVLAEMQDSAE